MLYLNNYFNMKLGVLVSGRLGFNTLVSLQDYEIGFVFTDNLSNSIIAFCKKNNIPIFIGNPRKEPQKVNQFIKDKPVEYIFSINYIFIIEDNLIKHSGKYSINLHGSLLPKYRGRTPHVWAIINGEEMTGVTAHLMVPDCDAGDIVIQTVVPIDRNDTGNNILERFNRLYPEIILEIIYKDQKNNLQFIKQDESKATYFGKRTPDDGMIDWNWQKERIFNWVRAQADPYPGAFSTFGEERVIIDKISFSDVGFKSDTPNGQILEISPIVLVKTPNGVVALDKIRENQALLVKEMKFNAK